LRPRDKITFEYILLKDVNDSQKDAFRLAKLLRQVRCKINLIPFNPHPGSAFQRPDPKAIEEFQAALMSKNYTVIIRWSKGADIAAACGQLKGMQTQSGMISQPPQSGCYKPV
jgi:23S rRNA (adenine2503-C2)-methyltransferase